MVSSVLHLDDDETMYAKAAQALSQSDFTPTFRYTQAKDVHDFYDTFNAAAPDCVLLDIVMGDDAQAGLRVLRNLRRHGFKGAAIMMSSLADPGVIRACVSAGADDFISKGLDESELAFRIGRCVDLHAKLSVQRGKRDAPVAGRTLREVELRMLRVRDSRIKSVLVTGESGTGKELVGECLQRSLRPGTPFVPVNCAAIAKDLLEAELFGYEKGAFTGANQARAGLFAAAHGGWIFLDEVARLSLACQAALLRTLENGEIRPVGGTLPARVQVRVIAATNEDLDAAVERGDFRGDLLSRLRSYEIFLPPLRERGAEELSEILDALLFRLNSERTSDTPEFRLSPAVRRLMLAHTWSRGNARELWQVLQATTVDAQDGLIAVGCLPRSFVEALGALENRPARTPQAAIPPDEPGTPGLKMPAPRAEAPVVPDSPAQALPIAVDDSRTESTGASSRVLPAHEDGALPAHTLSLAGLPLPLSIGDLENVLFLNCVAHVADHSPHAMQSQRKLAHALGLTRHSLMARIQRLAALQILPERFMHLVPEKDDGGDPKEA